MKIRTFLVIALALSAACPLAARAATPSPAAYNVVWDSPSKDVTGTMPVGNGDIGLNVWVENGDLLFLIGKSDAWDENAINCKLARVRVKISPNPFAPGLPFRQSLLLPEGAIEITGGAPGATVKTRIWVDANRPVVRVESTGDQPFTEEIQMENSWRDGRTLKTETSDLFKNLTGNDLYPTKNSPDVVVGGQKDRGLWYHQNPKPENDGYLINLKLQGMEAYADKIPHPLAGRTFGAAILGDGFVSVGERSLKSSQPARRQAFSVHPLTTLPANPGGNWATQLEAQIRKTDSVPLEKAWQDHVAWWSQFWARSWIHITDPASPGTDSAAYQISRAYQLCRFMNACAGRGAQPIKFNGSLFTVGTPENPDYRRWGGPGFWFQNQRLLYWPMLAAGDYDLMEPWFRMYREALPFAKDRTQRYFGHDGAFFGETIYFWGAEASGHYGWTPFEQRKSPLCECSYLTYYWQSNLENLAMMLDYFDHTGDLAFARQTLLPHAEEITKFYDLHYQRDAKGKIRFDPAQSLETWHTATNPLPEIAGLKTQMPRLLELPESLTTSDQRTRWKRLLDDAPPIPIGEKNGQKVILPAETFSREKNVENPELYGVFPYRLHGVGKPDLELARETFRQRTNKQERCWCQNDTQAALLGLTEEVKKILTHRASAASYNKSRFPAFWNSHYDWTPDVDHGGNLQLALQFLLLQSDGKTLPAWPKEWDVDFKLHAPGNTTIEGRSKSGELTNLTFTTPSERRTVLPE